ncbi:hypothetical protein LRQ11_30465 [Pseudomonas sp. MAFF 311095]|uniref:Uncharacterized protein n=1 Tax=Pseudomonas petroselini TaxID=2899822 RepID=A0ABS8R006_9PSED|nr:hypothetical protein [Pseudomonas petroselini]MCD7041274.1 hypothetical protein [Pseudomonas petroselini]MCD7044219.1 hypothetical protein [Pseudomonas petroselini]MCD7068301.1 hypothetical protein [Pseudomonas petroselini]MCD7082859.1 hypothetical protein [Pseudomonas petroselini]
METSNCYNSVTKEQRNITQMACQLLRDEDRNWWWSACFCCCSCFAWGTQIRVATGEYRIVQTIQQGDPVLTSTVAVVNGKPKLNWVSRPVTFSDGMAPSPGQPAVLLQYGDKGELVVTLDQPMVLADGRFKAADRLTLDDKLVDREGKPVKLHAVVLGKFTVGFHALATNDFSQHDPSLWCLETNGVVAGDHLVMAMQDDERVKALFVKGHDDLPRIGSAAYAQTHKGARDTAQLDDKARMIANDAFIPLDEMRNATSPVPYGSSPYMTQKQAENVLINGTFRSLGETYLEADFKYLRTLFNGFYPGINFYLNWQDLHPNQFAFNAYGQDTVYLSGQLLRLHGLHKQGLALIMAQGVARFGKSLSSDDAGLNCTGVADYIGANQVLQTVLYGSWNEWVTPGYAQVQALFALIDPANQIGHEKCATPSIPCRLESMEAAIVGWQLPACAGGPVPHSLELDSASWGRFEGALAILASFNQRLNPVLAKVPRSYQVRVGETLVPVALVQMDQSRPWEVRLIFDEPLAAEGPTTLTVRDIRSDNGSTLNPDASSVTVEGTP